MTRPIEFPSHSGVRFVKNVLMSVSDGVRLAMDLHVPDVDDWAAHPGPVLLEYLPYRKDEVAPYSGAQYLQAQHGYIGARFGCRGTGSSAGVTTDEYVEREQQDGAEAVEWIARQPWCTGKVGMFGKSYGGFTALQVAALQPPHLAAIAPVYFTDDRYTDDCHYRGGCLHPLVPPRRGVPDANMALVPRGQPPGRGHAPPTGKGVSKGCPAETTTRAFAWGETRTGDTYESA